MNANTAVQRAVDAALAAGEIGVQVAAYLDGELVVDVCGGLADEASGRPVDARTLFPVFSVTKAVAATALHLQAERGLLDYEAPIARYWPEFGAHGKGAATVRQVLTHRLGVPQMPADVTPDRLCDWEWMAERIAALEPIFPPGTRSAYLALNYGWLIGEIVRRTDPQRRAFGRFLQEEICAPLAIDDLWVGTPDHEQARVATLQDLPPPPPDAPPQDPETARLFAMAVQPITALTQEFMGRPDVRRACLPGFGGLFNARSLARFFALLAHGGALDGVRLLSAERVRSFTVPRERAEEIDAILGFPMYLGQGGFYLGGESPPSPAAIGRNPRTLAFPGAGGAVGWADLDARLAVGICHNRLFDGPMNPVGNPFVAIGDAIRSALGVPG
ncbi:MAG: serine hydrolase domain-containing protein [Candidatus Binatia bacterium]